MKSIKHHSPVTITAFIFVALIVFVLLSFSAYCHTRNFSNIVPLSISGHYSTDYITWQPITDETDFRRIPADNVYIKGHFDKDVSYSDHIQMQIKDNDLTVEKNGDEVFSNVGSLRQYSSSFAFSWEQIIDCSFTTDDYVTISISGEEAGITAYKLLNNLCISDQIELLQKELCAHPTQIYLSFLLLSFGIAFVLIIFILSLMHHNVPYYYLSCSLILISGALCSLVDYNFLSLIIPSVRLISFFDFLSQSVLCFCMLMYLRAFAKSGWIKDIVNSFIAITAAMVIFSVVLNFIDYVQIITFFNFLLYIVFFFIIITTMLIMYDYKNIHDRKIGMLLNSVYVLAASVVVEIVHFYITTDCWIFIFEIGLVIFTVLQFIIIMREAGENINKAKKMEYAQHEIEKSRIQIMMSQIQPHFLYNSLTSIARLCDKDPALAKSATLEFSKYLRGNLDSIKQDSNIMFEEELKHVKAYLTLEKVRFGDDLNLCYDIQATNFKLPPLAVQPVVENAVKYGIGQKESGGTITIVTKELEDHFEVIVSDDGTGFDVNKANSPDRSHIGIDNVRNRLASMANGTLTIESEIGVGTTATISIPKE